jgi:hypothetical protein
MKLEQRLPSLGGPRGSVPGVLCQWEAIDLLRSDLALSRSDACTLQEATAPVNYTTRPRRPRGGREEAERRKVSKFKRIYEA